MRCEVCAETEIKVFMGKKIFLGRIEKSVCSSAQFKEICTVHAHMHTQRVSNVLWLKFAVAEHVQQSGTYCMIKWGPQAE